MSTTAPATSNATLWAAAKTLMPGGVNSPVRAFKAVGGDPVFIESAQGAWLTDVEGQRYLDLVGAWGPAILGHAHPEVVAAIQAAAAKGTAFGTPSPGEVALAQVVVEAMPSVEVLRMVNSGTEATMSALRLARAATGREAIIKFRGCYHGHGDAFLVQAGSGVATLGLPDSPGVPKAVTAHTLVAEFNDLASVEEAFAARPGEVAGVIVEPVVGNAGVLEPAPGFLEGLRALCDAHGALLIFDEVMTGFRVAYGGAQARYGVKPDLTCMAKVLGGGVPAGAYGGRRELMTMVAPAGPMYQAGTLSGNPLATAAGLATLKALRAPGVYERLEAIGAEAEAILRAAADGAGVPIVLNRVGSMLTVFFGPGPITRWAEADQADRARYGAFFQAMLRRGVHLPPAQFEACFLSLAMGDAEMAHLKAAAEGAFAELASA